MEAKELIKIIEKYLTKIKEVDKLEGPYATRGIFLDEEEIIEGLEVGKDGKPLVQIILNPELRFEQRESSYLDITGFSGSAYKLTEQEYTHIESLIK